MPPIPRVKLPHGLKKDPRLMSAGEKSIFGLLAASIGLGVFQLATSPWGEPDDISDSSRQESSAINNAGRIGSTFGHERIQKMGGQSQTMNRMGSLEVDDGVTKVAESAPTPKVNDGVTGIQFGDVSSK